MTSVGTVIDGKYEILKEIGRGGMSIVYLAMDKRLNKQWAIKEIKKKGNGKNDEIIINSLFAEANMMKKLDHPSLPRIVDIIDNGITLYVIMDYIEGESLDKILSNFGPQSEDLVLGWAKQLADALSYLHQQKPPIIYRDMKPANVMLKPEGTIKIIDFGIAREYKEAALKDTTVLGTKGYAPPEQYSGQTDERSDIFALGMTMHHLLTGVDPRGGEPYAPVRQWNPELSEGIELIINKCVEPAAENRYQSCADLLYDLEHPELITRDFKKIQKRKFGSFIVAISLSALMLVSGISTRLYAARLNNQDYQANINTSNPDNYYKAIEIYPEKIEAYDKLILHYKNNDAKDEEILRIGNAVESNAKVLMADRPEVAKLYYNTGKLYFSNLEGSFKNKAINAKNFFKIAADSPSEFDKKIVAKCYSSLCQFMTSQSKSTEHSIDDFNQIFNELEQTQEAIRATTDYDKMTLYYTTLLFINDQAEFIAGVGFDRDRVTNIIDKIETDANAVTSSLSYVNDLRDEINKNLDDYKFNIDAKYTEVEKRKKGGN